MAAPTESPRTCTDWSKPTEWSDTERMHFLMAPFPPDKASVPEEDSKFIFWSNIIIKSTTQLNRISFSISELEDRFVWNSLRPKSLYPVLSTMERKGSIVRVDTYIKQVEQKNGLMSWSLSLVSQSLSWTWRYFTGSHQSSKPYQGKYVMVDRLQELCKVVYTSHNRTVVYKTTDNVMSLDQFVAACSPHLAVPEDVQLLQAEMVRQGLLCVSALQQGLQGVKFAPSLQEKLTSRAFSDADCAVLVLKETLKHVREQLARHKEIAERYYTAAKLELKSKRKIEAQNQLKKGMIERKKAEAAQRKIDNMEQILERIQQAESDAMVMEAYAGGLKAMKSALNALPMSKEELEDLMDQIQDLGEQQQHIQDAMTLTEMFGEEDDIEELEQQLDQLTLSEKLNVSTSERPPPTVFATSTAEDRSSEPKVVPGHSEKNSIKQLSDTLTELPEVPKNNPNCYHTPNLEECL